MWGVNYVIATAACYCHTGTAKNCPYHAPTGEFEYDPDVISNTASCGPEPAPVPVEPEKPKFQINRLQMPKLPKAMPVWQRAPIRLCSRSSI